MCSSDLISIETLYDGLATLLHYLSLAKIDQSILENSNYKSDLMEILNYASAQQLQTLYQICINGKKDLYLAPDLVVGLNMTFLRMLAFYPSLSLEKDNHTQNKSIITKKKIDLPPEHKGIENDHTFDGNWRKLVNDLDLGIAKTLAKETELINFINNQFNLKISPQNKHLTEKKYIDKLEDILSNFFEKKISINLLFSEVISSPSSEIKQENMEILDKTKGSIINDKFVKDLVSDFDGEIITSSIQPKKIVKG